MRVISEMTTQECCEVLCQIAQPVQRIVDDEALMSAVGVALKRDKKKELTFVGTMMEAANRISSAIPVLLRDHQEDVAVIIAAIAGTSTQEVLEQNVMTTMAQAREILKDKQLIDFFRQSEHMEATEY